MVRQEELRVVEEMFRKELLNRLALKKKQFSYTRCVVESTVIGES